MDMVVSWEWTRKLSLTGLVINAVISAVINVATCPNGAGNYHGN